MSSPIEIQIHHPLSNIPDRCKICNTKKYVQKCKCQDMFCPLHRLPNDHGCIFDWRSFYDNKLIKSLPKITSEKIQRI